MGVVEDLLSDLEDYKIYPKKELGQHFLISKDVVEKMVSLGEIDETDVVLEIGGGTGVLTKEILKKKPKKLVVFEVDKRLCRVLEKIENIELHCQDFLSFPTEKLSEVSKVVSSPPYYISKEIVEKLTFVPFKKAVLLFEREFCEKLVAEPGFFDYGFVSVIANIFFNVSLKYQVSQEAFYPKPSVVSNIVVFDRKKSMEFEEQKRLFYFLKQLFRYKNKNINKALKLAGFDLVFKDNRKVFELSPEEFIEMFKKLNGF